MFRERLLRSYWSRTSSRATYRISHFGIALHVVQRIGYCAHPPTQAQARDELRRRTETEDEEQATTIKVGLSASRGILPSNGQQYYTLLRAVSVDSVFLTQSVRFRVYLSSMNTTRGRRTQRGPNGGQTGGQAFECERDACASDSTWAAWAIEAAWSGG